MPVMELQVRFDRHADHDACETVAVPADAAGLLQRLGRDHLHALAMQYDSADGDALRAARLAARCYRAAADKGLAVAQRMMGECLMEGHGVEKDMQLAVHYCAQAASQGETVAHCHLGVIYIKGWGVERNVKLAVVHFTKAQDDPVALFNLGLCHANGSAGDSASKVEAVKYYEMAADQGLAEAQCNLALCLIGGVGCAEDPDKAAKLLQSAADQGLAAAQYNLGGCDQHTICPIPPPPTRTHTSTHPLLGCE